ncbi:hypothetical protein SEA_MAHAVRAT_75 [Mycobacterium phage Mahavrat]|uniref:Uncharacterized protein n=1 Tax=Mycobacterium phage Mahavrat TaxID=2591129 RepID=A0A515MLE0_9CAUD|nr:hypothetical protein I5H59_gp75 [Mycobacterium phage Mahavrat]QDM57459.1 hypothetical protein SEA_MAHAVRAT_75 [Mycobacterium phage Mahavrat]
MTTPNNPMPPTDVRIVYRNGMEVECPVKYLGFLPYPNEDVAVRYHTWLVVNEGPFDSREGDKIKFDFASGTSPMVLRVEGTGPREPKGGE